LLLAAIDCGDYLKCGGPAIVTIDDDREKPTGHAIPLGGSQTSKLHTAALPKA
jgi:hypothetical protein